jgi:hypothetical protein
MTVENRRRQVRLDKADSKCLDHAGIYALTTRQSRTEGQKGIMVYLDKTDSSVLTRQTDMS